MTDKPNPNQHDSVRQGMLFVLMAAMLWGTTGTAQAFAPASATPLAVGFVRIALGTVALIFIAARHGQLPDISRWRTWPVASTLVASVAIAAYQLFFFAGVARTGVAIGTIVGIGSTPIAAGILTFLIFRKVPEKRWVYSTALALAGCALLILSGGDLRLNGAGILLAMAAGASYALYTLASKELLAVKARGAVLVVTFSIGTLLMLPLATTTEFGWLAQPRGLLVAIHLGVITVGIAYQLYARGLSTVSVHATATLTLAEPLTAGLLGIVVLGESLRTPDLIGILLIMAGLLLLVIRPSSIRLYLERRLTA
jgi:DME family drug/metabolite transporter